MQVVAMAPLDCLKLELPPYGEQLCLSFSRGSGGGCGEAGNCLEITFRGFIDGDKESGSEEKQWMFR
ncbi:hypothetical protein L1887_07543 [Cichorium endivia]|nr:hypothetical protein L1887_07543 [Cichorium endivia]